MTAAPRLIGLPLVIAFVIFLTALPLEARTPQADWRSVKVPGSWEGSNHADLKSHDGFAWYRCWVKVPAHWVKEGTRDLWVDSVTFSIDQVADAHEVLINGNRIGGAGEFPPEYKRGFDGIHRYKIAGGILKRDQWNEMAVRIYNEQGPGGFLGKAPSIQGYFLECALEGDWEFYKGDLRSPSTGKALAKKPAKAAFESFKEASRILGEASTLMPGPKLSPAESAKRITVDDDLTIEQVLAEPLVAQPTHLSFDSRGRLWVSQYKQYPYPAGLKMISRDKYYRAKYSETPKPPPHHNRGRSKISIHEDSDGDGSYDKHKVFLEGLDLANSALPDHDGVWVMHTPHLLYYPDTNHDDVPDGDPEVHLSGFGFEDTHSIANGLVWGPDGWIYGGQGSTVSSRVIRPGIDEPGAPGVYHEGCMTWRYQPKTRTFEIFAEGGGNVFGLEFDAEGRLFSGHNGGDTRGWHYVQHGLLLKQGRSPNKFGPPANPFAFGDLPMMRGGKIPRFSHNTILCESTALPQRMQGRFLSADPLHHHLVLSERIRRGATFETKDTGFPLKSTDKGFRPVYLTNAPDGSVLIADFYNYYIAHGQHYQSQIDPTTGRIYRLKGKGKPLIQDVNLLKKSSTELIRLLDHPNKWHRQTAVRLLAHRQQERGLPFKLTLADSNKRSALHALWVLQQNERISTESLKHPDPAIRMWSVRNIGDRRLNSAASQLRECAHAESDLEVWSQLASTCQRLSAEAAMPVMTELLIKSGDLDDPYLPLLYWWAIESHCDSGRDSVLQYFEKYPAIWKQPMVRREILPRLMRRFAAQGREADFLTCDRLLRMAQSKEERAALMLGFEQAFQGGSIPRLPDMLLETMEQTGSTSLVLRVRQGEKSAIQEAMDVVSNGKASLRDRRKFVKALGESGEAQAKLEPLLLAIALSASQPDELRGDALTALQRYASPEIGQSVVDAYHEIPKFLKTSAQSLLASRPDWCRIWLEAIKFGGLKSTEVSREAIAVMRLHRENDLDELLDHFFGKASDPALAKSAAVARIARVKEIISGSPGSPYRGEPIYQQRCAGCHRLFHVGGRIGPDLTSYQRDDPDTMLTSIIDPSAEIREGFESYSLKTKDGRTLSGFLVDRGNRFTTIRGFDGADISIPNTDITERLPLGRSLMPDGLLDDLDEQQLRDLFAYLRISQPFLPPKK